MAFQPTPEEQKRQLEISLESFHKVLIESSTLEDLRIAESRRLEDLRIEERIPERICKALHKFILIASKIKL